MNFDNPDPEIMGLTSLLPNVDAAPLALPANNAHAPVAPLPRVADAAYASDADINSNRMHPIPRPVSPHFAWRIRKKLKTKTNERRPRCNPDSYTRFDDTQQPPPPSAFVAAVANGGKRKKWGMKRTRKNNKNRKRFQTRKTRKM
jgi:hypothetical protein